MSAGVICHFVELNDIEGVRAALERGESATAKNRVFVEDSAHPTTMLGVYLMDTVEGDSPLEIALRFRFKEIGLLLMEHGATSTDPLAIQWKQEAEADALDARMSAAFALMTVLSGSTF